MINDLVSIIVPVYNMSSNLEICVNSLLEQDYHNIEIILIDDGSTDNSLDKCFELQKKDNRIKVHHTSNNGSGPARNTGIGYATGDYLFFPDADDKVYVTAISELVSAMDNGNNDLVICGYNSFSSRGELVFKKEYKNLICDGENVRNNYSDYMGALSPLGIQGAPWNKLFKTSIIKKNKIQFPPLRRHQDEGFISSYMCYVRNVHFIESILYEHYVNDIKLEWKKYPVNYIDSVIGLYETRLETIKKWNPQDIITHKLIEKEYICNVIKALELSFSPKNELTKKQRIKKIINEINRSKIRDFNTNEFVGNYQRFIFKQIKKEHYNYLYYLLKSKTVLEQTRVYKKLKGK